jgi:N-acetylglucosamine-6-phosphate deacetylase
VSTENAGLTPSSEALPSGSVTGKLPGSESTVSVEFSNVVESVDELISPPDDDLYIAPGFIDVQVNGFGGVDYNDPSISREDIIRSVRTMFQTGVTRLFPTVITGSKERMVGALRNLTAVREWLLASGMPEGHAIEAFHVEGPHISAEDGPRGAHPREHVRPPSIEEFKQWQDATDGNVKIVTVSPEWEDTPGYIREIVRAGVVASIGHTKASSEQIEAAVDAGATMSTHLGNGAHAQLPKTSNYIWDQLLQDRLTASFVLDGIHIPQVFVRAAFRCKGLDKSVLVTDAVMPAMCPPGHYRLGQLDVQLLEGNKVVLLDGSRLAGSALRMDTAVENAVRLGGVPLRQVLAMATTNVARVARIAGRQRGLASGEKADFVRFRWDESEFRLTVVETIVAGETVYRA